MSKPEQPKTCETCEHFDVCGTCRKSPPVWIPPYEGRDGYGEGGHWRWPAVDEDDWCGEHKEVVSE